MTEYLTQEQILLIHEAVLDPNGHEGGVLNWGILYMIPYHVKGRELYDGVATQMIEISEYQPMRDGNRRTAFVSAVVTLRMNGIKLKARKFDTHHIMTRIKDGMISKQELIDRLKQYTKPIKYQSFEESLKFAVNTYKDIINSLEGLKDQ